MRLVISILTYAFLLLGLLTLRGDLLVLAIPLVVYLGSGLLFGPEELRLHAERRLSSERVVPNMPVIVTLKVSNQGAQLERVLIEDLPPPTLELVDGQSSVLTTLAPGATVELTYTLRGARGEHRFAGVRATASDYFGLTRRQIVLALREQLVVLPEVARLREFAIRPRRTRVPTGTIPARLGGPGIEFFGVRAYQPGDPTRWINARISARHQEALFVNEFEQERAADVTLILDARRSANESADGRSLFDRAINATASLAEALLASGNRVGMLVYGRSFDWTIPGYGKVQRERMLRALARAATGDSPAFAKLDDLPTNLFSARAQLILISPLLQADYELLVRLRARGYSLLVISPDPIAFEAETLPANDTVALATRIARLERELLLRRLRHAGVQVIDWRVDTPLRQLAEAALRRLPAFISYQNGER